MTLCINRRTAVNWLEHPRVLRTKKGVFEQEEIQSNATAPREQCDNISDRMCRWFDVEYFVFK